MEPLYLAAIWLFGIYFIRIHLELKEFKKQFNKHRDIYVPSYEELMRMNHWTIQLARFLVKELHRAKKNTAKKNMYPAFENKDDLAYLALVSGSDKGKSALSHYNEYENNNE